MMSIDSLVQSAIQRSNDSHLCCKDGVCNNYLCVVHNKEGVRNIVNSGAARISASIGVEEGGGTTSTYPFEKWRYRWIEGIGSDIIIEFVDTTMTGEYRMTMDPSEKDALLYVPNAGLTLAEQMGLSTKTARFHRRSRYR